MTNQRNQQHAKRGANSDQQSDPFTLAEVLLGSRGKAVSGREAFACAY
jgi:hypothetical protein